jgi:hypothetical protein
MTVSEFYFLTFKRTWQYFDVLILCELFAKNSFYYPRRFSESLVIVFIVFVLLCVFGNFIFSVYFLFDFMWQSDLILS